ncbi:MAG TPA: FlgD immunoglobulin-like domain containing protein [Gaiellaceae bacterium]|nr:FlgD immunoglobulin-like domain containing protein [Gaiellaceae bacterium]
MARIASTVLVVALLAATAAAFALTQGLKLQPAPIRGTVVDAVFSPVCACDTATATISFVLRERDRVDLAIVDGSGDVVRTVVRDAPYPAGRVSEEWDGRDDAGRVLPEGEYAPRVHLDDARFTTTLPNPIRIDVTPPQVEMVSVEPKVFSPDGDGRADRVVVRYRTDEPAKGLLFVDGTRRVRNRFARTEDRLVWSGRLEGRAFPAGTYVARVAAEDPAGNVSERSAPVPLVLRYVALGRDRIVAGAGERLVVRVSADAERVRWTLGGRSGFARPGTLRLRAPLQKGQFTLTVSTGGHAARAAVFVREPGP